jgi:hypothetical protein
VVAQRDALRAELNEKAARLAELWQVLEVLDANPYGCPMCDSGRLRDSTKQHWPECGHARMRALLDKRL